MTDEVTPAPDAEVLAPAADLALRGVILEIERHVAAQGWDAPARMFALVHTEELLVNEPGLVEMLGIDPNADLTGSLTPIEQEALAAHEQLEQVLTQVGWPEEVFGAAVAVERLVLPPSVTDLPEDPGEAQAFAETHPERQEVRMVVGATRSGSGYCALRLRSHDEDFAVLDGPDLVPALLELVAASLEVGEPAAPGPDDPTPVSPVTGTPESPNSLEA